MNISDQIVKILENNQIERCFMVTGGGSMHLNEAFRKNKAIKVLPMHHEQACSMAADSYARLHHKPAVVNVTTGPGVINSLNGVFGAFTDSLPMIVISGQVKSETYSKFSMPEIRQLGDQEVKTEELVKTIVKKVVTLGPNDDVQNVLQDLINTSMSGRPGPVWLDVPIELAKDLRSLRLDAQTLRALWHWRCYRPKLFFYRIVSRCELRKSRVLHRWKE